MEKFNIHWEENGILDLPNGVSFDELVFNTTRCSGYDNYFIINKMHLSLKDLSNELDLMTNDTKCKFCDHVKEIIIKKHECFVEKDELELPVVPLTIFYNKIHKIIHGVEANLGCFGVSNK